MLFAVSGLEGCTVKASDGDVGTVKDFLFDDQNWKIRWIVVGAGHWLPGRQVFIHPSAIAPLTAAAKAKAPDDEPRGHARAYRQSDQGGDRGRSALGAKKSR